MSTIANARDRPEKAEIQKIKQKIKKAINSNERVLSFLKENNVNSLIQDSYRKSIVVEKIIQNFNPINCAFTWSETSEGHKFWNKHNLAYKTIKNKEY